MQKVWVKESMNLIISNDGASEHLTPRQITAVKNGKVSVAIRSKLRRIGINLAIGEELAVREG